MAFPVIHEITQTELSSMTTTHNINLPATVNAGDLLVMIFVGSQVGADESYTITDPSGFTLVFEDQYTADGRQNTGVYFKEAVGNEDGTTVNVATSQSVSAVAQVYRIQTGTHNGAVEASSRSEAEAANPNPPSLTPSWGAADTLWLACMTHEDSDFGATAAPTNYTNLTTSISDSSEDAVLSTARRENNTATEDPGAFTADAEKYQAFTLGIEPAGGGATGGYLVHEEDGTSRFELEDSSGFLILEETVDAPTGTAAVTLDNFTSTASGTLTISGTSATTLQDFTSSATGVETFSGSAAVTLDNFTSAASGTESMIGTSATTLQDFTSTASGTHTDTNATGSAAVTLEDFTSAATGVYVPPPITGDAAVTLEDFTSTASGTSGYQGSAAIVLDDFVGAGTGDTFFIPVGTADVLLEDFVMVGVGVTYHTNHVTGGYVDGGSLAWSDTGGSNNVGSVAGGEGRPPRAGGTTPSGKVEE